VNYGANLYVVHVVWIGKTKHAYRIFLARLIGRLKIGITLNWEVGR